MWVSQKQNVKTLLQICSEKEQQLSSSVQFTNWVREHYVTVITLLYPQKKKRGKRKITKLSYWTLILLLLLLLLPIYLLSNKSITQFTKVVVANIVQDILSTSGRWLALIRTSPSRFHNTLLRFLTLNSPSSARYVNPHIPLLSFFFHLICVIKLHPIDYFIRFFHLLIS